MPALFRSLFAWRILSAVIFISFAAARVPTKFGREDTELAFADGIGFNFTTYGLRKRTYVYEQAVQKGKKLLELLNGSRRQSPWSMAPQLTDNGWTSSNRLDGKIVPDYAGAGGPYESLHIDDSKGYLIRVAQNRNFDLCHAKDVEATEGYYSQIYNVPNGAIIGMDNFSPLVKIKRMHSEATEDELKTQILPNSLPTLRRWSDVTFIIWSDEAHRLDLPVNSLKYVFKHFVTTKETSDIMKQALKRKAAFRNRMPEWPGIQYSAVDDGGDDGFLALLGTPHGRGVAYLLYNHPIGLGRKGIESITMFATNVIEESLLFTLTD